MSTVFTAHSISYTVLTPAQCKIHYPGPIFITHISRFVIFLNLNYEIRARKIVLLLSVSQLRFLLKSYSHPEIPAKDKVLKVYIKLK